MASLDRAQHNLPIQTSSFLGRDREVAELVELVTRERLVTITGFGGMGKTRLALQVAAELAVGDGDGVWFVDLSNETDPDRVPSMIASTLGIADGPEGTLASLLAGLKDKQILLVLDNLEQLLPQAALLVDRLARAGDRVRILTTCREPLRVGGEHEYPLQPLPLPAPIRPGAVLSDAEVGRLSTYAAVSLFITRATAARPDFRLNPANAAAVATICARLDGLPLALELAAARTRSMSPDALLPRLDHALKVLTGGDRTLPTRHQTLSATIAWSYDALEANEQKLLDRLSVFPGSFTLDAAEQICGPAITEVEDYLDVLDGIGVLVDRSLLRHHPATDDQPDDRCSLLATIQDYATSRLQRTGHLDTLAARHADYYTRLVTLPPDFTQEQYASIRPISSPETRHLFSAVNWQHERGSAEEEHILCRPLVTTLLNEGQTAEVRRLGIRVLSRPGASPAMRVWMMATLAFSESNEGRLDQARGWAEQGLAEARALSDRSVLADHLIAVITVERSRSAARRFLDQAAALVDGLPERGGFRPPWVVRLNLEGNASSLTFTDPIWAEAATRRQLASARPHSLLPMQAILGGILAATCQFPEAEVLLSAFEPDGGDPTWDWIDRITGCRRRLSCASPPAATTWPPPTSTASSDLELKQAA